MIVCKNCGTVDDYFTEKSGPHLKAMCCNCGTYIKFLPQTSKPKLHFGKYKGRDISSMTSEPEIKYLQWCLATDMKTNVKRDISEHLQKLNRS